MFQETEDGNVTIDENAAPKEDGEKTEETIEKVIEEEEPKQLTLDEWKALQKGAVDQPSFNIRKAGEGANIDPKWKKAAAYMKEKEDDADETGYAEVCYLLKAGGKRILSQPWDKSCTKFTL